MPEIRIKQGASLLLQLTFQDDLMNPLDLTNFALSSQVRTAIGDLVAVLPIVKTSATGIATVTVPGSSTVLWPIGMLRADILGVAAGVTSISETFGVRVERAVTAA